MPLQKSAPPPHRFMEIPEALGFVVAAIVLTALIQPDSSATQFAFFHAAVALSAWRGTWRGGLLATLLSMLAVDFFFIKPGRLVMLSSGYTSSFVVFAAVSLFISYIVTLQRDTSRDLQRQRVTTQDILENINDMFFAIDSQWRLTYINQKARTYHSNILSDALGADFWDVFQLHKGTETEARFRRVMETRQPEFWETEGRYSKGYFRTSVYPTQGSGLSVFVADITQQRMAQIAEQDARDRLDIALSAGDIGTWQWNVARDHLQLSPRAFTFFGIAPDENFSFIKMQTHLHPDDVERIKEEVAFAVRDANEHDFEYRVNHPDGTQRILTARGRAVVDETGVTTHLVGVVQDITERKNAADAVAQSAQQLKLALDAAQAGTWDWDVSSGKTIWSDELYHVFGISREEYPPSQNVWKELVHVEDRDLVKTEFQRAVEEKSDFDLEHRIAHQGVVRWINSRGRCFFDDKGELMRTTGIVVDITERKDREAERRVLERRFQTMADSAPVLIWIADIFKSCTWFNQAWLEWTGRTQQQEYGNGWTQSVHPDDLERCLEIYTSSFNARESFSMEFRLRHRSGEYRWLLDNGRPLWNASGEFLGFIGSCVDIEDIKQAQAERDQLLANERAARSEAERVSRMKDEFLATLSHELRTPLNAVLGWASLLRSGALAGEEATQGLEVIERNARVQAQLIEDLLDMSRIISGKLRLDVQNVELAAVIGAAIESLHPAANAKDIQLHRVLDPAVVTVMGDPNRLQQVVWNLLSNAVKFTPQGGRIEIALRRVNSNVEITVSDSGDGISPGFLPHVFDRFRQADSSSTRQYGGLGLGLGIVRNLVELHGGTVSASSEGEGKGATFTVSLPQAIIRAEAPNRAQTAQTFIDNPCPPVMQGLRILVVDDEVDARYLVQRILQSCGAEVAAASSAQEAFDYICEHRLDILVSDIGMPGEDGYSLMKRVRALPEHQGRDIRAVALTALAREEDKQRALLAGFQRHHAKPVDPPELIAVIAEMTDLSHETIVAGQSSEHNTPEA